MFLTAGPKYENIYSGRKEDMNMKKLDGILDSILERKRLAKLENRIHRSSYWGTYSRILSLPEENERGGFIELNLTPVNGFHEENDYIRSVWEKNVRRIVIREHG